MAPRWHTAAFVSVVLAVALAGTLVQRASGALPPAHATGSRIWSQYAPLFLVQWGLVFCVARVGRSHNALPELLGKRWNNVRRAATDSACAVGGWLLIVALESLSAHYTGVGRNAAVTSLLPSTEAERLTWVLIATSVGFCEEVVYRGYLQQQLTAFTHRALLGVSLQAIVFGIAHLEQGPRVALRVAAYGLLFGVMARARGSLIAGILCHVALDLTSGLWHA